MEIVLAYVAKKERFDLPPKAAVEIIEDSNGNMRKAILVLEALKMQSQVCSFRCVPLLIESFQTGLNWKPVDRKTGLGDVLSQGRGPDHTGADTAAGDGRTGEVV